MSFSLSQFAGNTSNKHRSASRTFPLRLDGFNLDKIPHTITGVDLSAPEQAPVTVFLRPRDSKEGEGARPEIINFVEDAIKKAEKGGDAAELEAVRSNPLSKLFTEPGGVILVEGGFTDEESGHISASWLRLLKRHSDVVSLYTNVWARVNKPYTREGATRLTASIDILHPEQKVRAQNLSDLNSFLMDVVGRISGGESIAVVKLSSSTATEDCSVRTVKAQRISDGYGEYVWDAPEVVVDRFWDSLDAEWISSLNEALITGSVIAEIYPGARYYFVKDSLEQIARKGEKHYSRFVLPNKEETGFLRCTVTLRSHAGSDSEKYPTGCFPIHPFTDRPLDLVNL
ncbi:hypothetical protein [Methylovorus glucosotrophus]|uniref:Uncharacterized protein n=1 Tax=Methylovorus glucosotrophus (strain SIP3-4) TaxID=582744 RepID=C6XEL8_METGS|nr:hypothetical protein [Methylovorus glucosotrophus]ACT52075.1 hypothetical protein Msip34_2851 [Methylovorus glucosotrophus SIP3-4]